MSDLIVRLLADFGEFMRLRVADGDASAHTVRNYHTQAGLWVAWCNERGINPALATEADVTDYRRYLVEQSYSRETIALKLAVVRRLYEAATWRGLRLDNPAAGIKAPREKTARAERVKFLPLAAVGALLAAPAGDTPQAKRDRAILALMVLHGPRVAEVAGAGLDDLSLERGTLTVHGKGRKTRTIYLTERTARLLADWLEARVGLPGEPALFVVLGHNGTGGRMTTRAIRYLVDGYLEQIGQKAAGVSCHSLRHSAATWARAGGATQEAVGDMLGHANPATTAIYTHLVNRMAENPAAYLERLLG
ncbi:MAG: tyrosine-type recombinase/integrase [Chloroflexota bacterium]